jgi:hypothetical protein
MRVALPVLALAATAALTACSSPRGTAISPADLQRMERADAARGAAPAGAADPASPAPAAKSAVSHSGETLTAERAKQRNDLDDRRMKLARRREDQARNQGELEAKRSRIALEQSNSGASEGMAVQQAERDRRVANEDLQRFLEVEKARRLAEDALDVSRAQDGLLETREELAQLEMMYSESSLGDATAEIVLNRTRRRLQRAEEGFRLRSERSDELKQVTLPRDQQKLELELAAKTVALENSQRTRDAGRLQREAALRDLDFEARKLQREAEDIELEDTRLQQDLARFERDLSNDRTSATASSSP